MDLVMFGDPVDGVDWPGREVRMIEIWIVINAIAVALAGLRGIQNHRRERHFWLAREKGHMQRDAVAGPYIGGRDL